MKTLLKKILTTVVVVSITASISQAIELYDPTIIDQNSSAIVDETGGGMYNWTVDEQNILNKQWFYYGVQDERGEWNVSGIEAVGFAGSKLSDTDTIFGDSNVDTLSLTYLDEGQGIQIDIKYSLDGGTAGSLQSDIAEQISITNLSDSNLSLQFYQYSDFNLSLDGEDVVAIKNDNSIVQTGDNGLYMNETVVSPQASQWMVGDQQVVFDAVMSGDGLTEGPDSYTGDAAWAFQWDFDLAAGSTYQISKDKNTMPAPEPSSFALMLIGMFGLSAYRKRRQS